MVTGLVLSKINVFFFFVSSKILEMMRRRFKTLLNAAVGGRYRLPGLEKSGTF